MKPIAITASLILVTLSLYASDPQSQGKDAKPKPDTHIPTLFSAPATGNIGDSPLVRAAKASRRTGIKSATVITNDTLVRTGGHFTTTSSQQPVPVVRPANGYAQVEEKWLTERRRVAAESAAAAEAARKTAVQKQLAIERAEQLMDGDTAEAILNDPPPLEGPIQTMKPATPQTMKPNQPTQPNPPQ
jgi:hypothetical protein